MLTLFTTAKPFQGHSAVIQRNALKSWTLLHPGVEVILFGDDLGAAEIARELGIRHEPHVERNESGMKRIDYFFDRASEIARHDILCYVNCDILLFPDFYTALQRVKSARSQFLMVGRRWDMNISQPIDFNDTNWAQEIWRRAQTANQQRDAWWIDYFAFSRNLYHKKIPPFVISRVRWDNWLVWYAANAGASVVDVSPVVHVVHQNHDYGYHPKGQQGVFDDEHSQHNFQLAGGWNCLRTIDDATHVLARTNLRLNWKRYWRTANSFLQRSASAVWFSFLNCTRPLRNVLGLRYKAARSRESAGRT